MEEKDPKGLGFVVFRVVLIIFWLSLLVFHIRHIMTYSHLVGYNKSVQYIWVAVSLILICVYCRDIIKYYKTQRKKK